MTIHWRFSRRLTRTLLLLVVLLALGITGCGVKGDPTAMQGPFPPNIQDVTAIARAGAVDLGWAVPERSVDAPYVGFQLYRKHWTPEAEPIDARAETLLLADIERVSLNDTPRVEFADTDIKSGHRYEYHLFTYDISPEGEKIYGPDIALGPFIAAFPDKPEQPLTATGGEGLVQLSWGAPDVAAPAAPSADATADTGADAAGETSGDAQPEAEAEQNQQPVEGPCVMIYRAEGEEPFGPAPLIGPIFGSSYDDGQVVPKLTYRYKLRAARLTGGVLIEGGFGEPVSISVVDETPPPAPVVLWIKQVDGYGVRLRWQPVADAGLLGYGVQRRAKDEKDEAFKDVSGFITVDEYTDRSLSAPGEFVYRIWARDRAGNVAFSELQQIPVAEPAPEPEPELSADAAAGESDAADQSEPTPADTEKPTQEKPADAPVTDGK